MQRPDPDSAYFEDFREFQQRLSARLKHLRLERGLKQEDMTDFELSLRQYQRMEQDSSTIVSLWQIYKLAKAFDTDVSELLDL